MNDLRELLTDAAAEPEDQPDLPDRTLTEARRRLRRRRSMALMSSSTAVAIIAVCVALTPRLAGLTDQRPGSHVEPVGPTTTLKNAHEAVAGRDYDVLVTHVNQNLDRANGQYFQGGISADGKIGYVDGPHGIHNKIRIGLLDVSTKQVQWLPKGLYQGMFVPRLVAVTSREVVVVDDSKLAIRTYDRSTGGITTVRLNPADLGFARKGAMPISFWRAVVGPDHRLYFQVSGTAGGRHSLERFPIWSVPLDGSAPPARLATGGDFDVTGHELTYAAYTNRPSATITVLDLGSGRSHSFASESGSRCNSLSLDRQADKIVMYEYCGQRNHVRDDRIQIVTASGRPVMTIRGNGIEGSAVSDRFVEITSYEHQPGTYLYDLNTGRVSRLSHEFSKFAGGFDGNGSEVGWSTPVNDKHGQKTWIARFH